MFKQSSETAKIIFPKLSNIKRITTPKHNFNRFNFDINNNNNKQSIQNSNKPRAKPGKTIAKLIKEFNIPDSNNDKNNNINESDLLKQKENSEALNGIAQQIKAIEEGQNQFLIILNNLQRKIDDNYSNLNERISALENYYIKK